MALILVSRNISGRIRRVLPPRDAFALPRLIKTLLMRAGVLGRVRQPFHGAGRFHMLKITTKLTQN